MCIEISTNLMSFYNIYMLLLLNKSYRCFPITLPRLSQKSTLTHKPLHAFTAGHGQWYDPNLSNSFNRIANL